METLTQLFTDYTLRTVALGACLIGAVAGALGVFAVQRRQSLLGDALSHAALPGVALAFLLTGSKQPLALALGALAAGWLGALLVLAITRLTRIKSDSALGLVLAVFFGAGLVLLGYIQTLPSAAKAGLDRFLFGNASTMLLGDARLIAALGCSSIAALVLLWKEFKLITFDYEFSVAQGWPVRALDILLTSLIVLAIVTGLQAVGVVLMSALLVAPAAAARQWSNRLSTVVLIAGGIGAACGLTGALASSSVPKLPTGPAIVLAASAAALFSLLLAPARGVVWAWLHHRRQHGQVRQAAVLAGMLALGREHADPQSPHDIAALDAVGVHSAGRTMPVLEKRGLVRRDGVRWGLTTAGVAAARQADSLGRAEAELDAGSTTGAAR